MKISKDQLVIGTRVIVAGAAELSSIAVISRIVENNIPNDAKWIDKKWLRLGGYFIGGLVGAAVAKQALEAMAQAEDTTINDLLYKGTKYEKKDLEVITEIDVEKYVKDLKQWDLEHPQDITTNTNGGGI
jgi:hypothetical protein